MLGPLVMNMDEVLGEGRERGVDGQPLPQQIDRLGELPAVAQLDRPVVDRRQQVAPAVALAGSSRRALALARAASSNRFSLRRSTPRL